MFEGFANVWTIVGLARDLPAGKLQPLLIAGERVVIFRDGTGKPAALIDRCPHRGVALSLGKVRDGIVECPFHGWRFESSGANCHVPWEPDAKRGPLGATAVPIRERAGLLWLYTGADPAGEPEPSESLLQPGITLCSQDVVWAAHWTRAMENMLDVPHLPFVHKRTIGRGVDTRISRTMDVSWTETALGGKATARIEGRDKPIVLNFLFPNAMELVLDMPGRVFRVMAVCLPEGPKATRMIFLTIRNFARLRLFDPLFHYSNRRISIEDQAVVESSDPVAVPEAGKERSVRTDAPTLAFRKLYFERLKDSAATLRPR